MLNWMATVCGVLPYVWLSHFNKCFLKLLLTTQTCLWICKSSCQQTFCSYSMIIWSSNMFFFILEHVEFALILKYSWPLQLRGRSASSAWRTQCHHPSVLPERRVLGGAVVRTLDDLPRRRVQACNQWSLYDLPRRRVQGDYAPTQARSQTWVCRKTCERLLRNIVDVLKTL